MSNAALAEPIPGIGDNLPPSDYQLLTKEVDSFLATADKWLAERPKITDADMAAKAEDFDTQLRALEKKIASMEETEKRPLMTALEEVRSRFKKLSGLVGDVRKLFITRRETWLLAEQQRIAVERRKREEEARLAQEEADRKAREAQEIAEAAQAGELQGQGVSVTGAFAEARKAQEIAEAAQAQAKSASDQRATVRGDLGGKATGLKTFFRGEIVDNGKLLSWVKKNRPDELMAFLQKYADTYARSPELRKTGLPGVEFHQEQRL